MCLGCNATPSPFFYAGLSRHTCCCILQGDGSQITVEPGLIGGEVNRILAAHKNKHNHPIQYKIGPDPSSIDSCMVRLLP